MVYDTLKNILRYQGLSVYMDTAISYLSRTALQDLEVGKYPIDGDNVFFMVQNPTSLKRSSARWESHEKYIDIQILLHGEEAIGFQKTDNLRMSEEYSAEKDIAFYEENQEGFFVKMKPLHFVMCFPDDAHMPLVHDDTQKIKKIVVKVKVQPVELCEHTN